MKNSLSLVALVAMTSICAGAIAATPEQEIRQLEAEINGAYAKNDLPKYFSYYADDFRGIFPDGTTVLNDYRKEWSASVNAGNIVLAFTYSDMQVQTSPSADAAVVSYRATARMSYVGKAPVDENYFETDVFFKRGGIWKLVEVHYSPVAEKQ